MIAPCLDTLEQETRSSVLARRNFHFGLWAGRRLGLGEEALARYTRNLMTAGLGESGPLEMVGKVAADFRAQRIEVAEAALLENLRRLERQVRRELLVTD